MLNYIPPKQEVIKPGESIMKRIGEKGIIIAGYQGIGKTSIASKQNGIIDLDSSVFKIDDNRTDDWYIIYCRIAVSLAEQGYTVLTSSHSCVIEEFDHYNTNGNYSITIVCPYYHLKDFWIERLKKRYDKDPSVKNYISWKDTKAHFTDEITQLASCSTVSHIFIDSMDYDLYSIIRGLRYMNYHRVNPLTVGDHTEGC